MTYFISLTYLISREIAFRISYETVHTKRYRFPQWKSSISNSSALSQTNLTYRYINRAMRLFFFFKGPTFCSYRIHKRKVHPRTGYEGQEKEKLYSSTLSLISALEGVGGQRHAPDALPPWKTRYPLYRSWVSPRADLDGCEKSRYHRDSIPRPSSP